MANEINQVKVGSTTYTLQDSRVDSLVTGVSSVNSKTGDVSLDASDVGALSEEGGNISGHIYLTGAKESSSTGNTSQIVFGTSSNNHVAVSSNANALVINPTTSTTTNQIVLYLDKASVFPNGISGNASSATTAANATKLNGQAASYYAAASSVPVNATTSAVAPSACTSNGFYYVSSGTNSLTDKDGNPFLQYHTAQDFRILATAYSASWIQQIATDFRSEHVYIRRCENGTWKPWTKIAQTSEIPTSNATTSAAGLMSAADKTKLDNVSSINEIDLWYDTVTDLTVNEYGINWYDSFDMAGPSGSTLNGTLTMNVPIVAGSNISITKNDSGKAEIGWSLADRITKGSGLRAVCVGMDNSATGQYSMAVNNSNTAAGVDSFASGVGNTANAYQAVFGKYATDSAGPLSLTATVGDIFKIGKGTSTSALANAMRVTVAGKVYGQSSFGSSGADYAEMWEWADGNPNNEDRRGKFVTVDENNKIRIATTDDEYILGIISATPCVVGDVQSENWREMYLKDVFGQPIVKKVDVPERVDEETGELVKAHTEEQWVLNPEYDPTRPYISRDERKEWAAVGLMGKLVVIDDGTCVAGRYCKLTGNGTATASTDKNDWRVLKRMDSTHVQILYR